MLIYLADLFHDSVRGVSTVPLNVGYIAAYAKARFADAVDIRLFKRPSDLLDAIDARPPDVLGLSNYMWNLRLNAFVGQYAKRHHPGCMVVMGGPNIRTDRDGIQAFLAANHYVDHYCLYAGEMPFANLLAARRAENGDFPMRGRAVPGCFTLDGDTLVGEALIDPRPELDHVPSPYLTGLLDEALDAGHIPMFETNRGCPYSCTFCVWGISALSKVKTFALERVTAEMNHVAARGARHPRWILADANFGILKRDVQIAALLRAIHDARRPFLYLEIWWAKNPRPHMLDVARHLGTLTSAYIAFQSFDDEVLAHIRRGNIPSGKLAAFKGEIERHTDGSITDILLGLPGETRDSHIDSLNRAIGHGFTRIGGGEVRMLPGSEMDEPASRERYAIRTKWRVGETDAGIYRGTFVYELEEVVRATSTMSEADMLDLRSTRAVLYGSLTVGQFLPLLQVMAARGMDVFRTLRAMLEPGGDEPELDALFETLRQAARAEWFDSIAAAEAYFADPRRVTAWLDNPPVKLNYWFVAQLMGSPTLYAAFERRLRRVITAAGGLDDGLVEDLLTLCRQRNYLARLLAGEDRDTDRVVIGADALDALREIGYVAAVRPGDGLVLDMDANDAAAIRHLVGSQRCVRDAELSQMLQNLNERIFMRPRQPADARAVA